MAKPEREENVAVEGEESVFSGSISELQKKPYVAHPIIQFIFHREPHWMFALIFSQALFWERVRPPVPRYLKKMEGAPNKPSAARAARPSRRFLRVSPTRPASPRRASRRASS